METKVILESQNINFNENFNLNMLLVQTNDILNGIVEKIFIKPDFRIFYITVKENKFYVENINEKFLFHSPSLAGLIKYQGWMDPIINKGLFLVNNIFRHYFNKISSLLNPANSENIYMKIELMYAPVSKIYYSRSGFIKLYDLYVKNHYDRLVVYHNDSIRDQLLNYIGAINLYFQENYNFKGPINIFIQSKENKEFFNQKFIKMLQNLKSEFGLRGTEKFIDIKTNLIEDHLVSHIQKFYRGNQMHVSENSVIEIIKMIANDTPTNDIINHIRKEFTKNDDFKFFLIDYVQKKFYLETLDSFQKKIENIFLTLAVEIIKSIYIFLDDKKHANLKNKIRILIDNIQNNSKPKSVLAQELKQIVRAFIAMGGINKIFPINKTLLVVNNQFYKFTPSTVQINRLLNIIKN